MKKFLKALLISTSLSMVFLSTVQAETVPNSSAETTGQYMGLSATTAKVKAELLTKKKIDSNDITVQSKAGPSDKDKVIVTLTGCQKTKFLATLADTTAKQVEGVSQVNNKLEVSSRCGE